MSHNLNSKGNNISFVSKKEIAWHRLGKVVDAMTSEEAIKLGGLDFKVNLAPLLAVTGEELSVEESKKMVKVFRNKKELREVSVVSNAFATYRTDTNEILGIVGNKYTPVQNTEAFDFFDNIIGEGQAQYETVGALGKGETVFITAKLPEICIGNTDNIDNYLLFTMSHDGSSAIKVMFTPIRVVCNNTLSIAVNSAKDKISIKHTKNYRNKLELAKKVLQISNNQKDNYYKLFTEIYNKSITDEKAKLIISNSLKLDLYNTDNMIKLSKNQKILNDVFTYYQTGIGQEEIVGTGWGVFNAVSGYLQNIKEYSNDERFFINDFSINEKTRTETIKLILN